VPANRCAVNETAQILAAAAELSRRGVLSASGHGNVSTRLPGSGEVLYTAHPSLHTLQEEHIARLSPEGEVLSGTVPALSADALRMHLAVYRTRPDVACVIHTHSPFATAYAVAGQPIGCWAEPLSIFGMAKGVPLAPYARRGSDDAVRLVAESCAGGGVRAVLLQNHGVLSFGDVAATAVHVATLVEEAAQLGIRAAALGGPVLLPAGPE
jgi:L-ribulose-5-phosphate 4-epimerase